MDEFLPDIDVSDIHESQGAVFVVTGSDHSGTDFPVGTPQRPVNNIDDAIDIAEERNLHLIYVATPDHTTISPSKSPGAREIVGLGAANYNDLNWNMNDQSYEGTFFKNFVLNGNVVDTDFLQAERCVLGMGASLTGPNYLAVVDCLIHNFGIECDYAELWNCVSDNRMMVYQPPEITCKAVQFVNCKGQYEVHDLELITGGNQTFIQIDGGLVIDDSCEENSIQLITGDCSIEGYLDAVNLDYTLQGRDKGLDAIYDKIDTQSGITPIDGATTYADTGGEQEIFSITPQNMMDVLVIKLKLGELTESGTWRLYIDGELHKPGEWENGVDPDNPFIRVELPLNEEFSLTWEEDEDEGVDRLIEYSVRHRGE